MLYTLFNVQSQIVLLYNRIKQYIRSGLRLPTTSDTKVQLGVGRIMLVPMYQMAYITRLAHTDTHGR